MCVCVCMSVSGLEASGIKLYTHLPWCNNGNLQSYICKCMGCAGQRIWILLSTRAHPFVLSPTEQAQSSLPSMVDLSALFGLSKHLTMPVWLQVHVWSFKTNQKSLNKVKWIIIQLNPYNHAKRGEKKFFHYDVIIVIPWNVGETFTCTFTGPGNTRRSCLCMIS